MPLLIIQPNFTSKEAQKWLEFLFIQMLDAIDLDEQTTDDLTYCAECLSYEDVDAIFEKAMKGLLE